MRCGYLYVGAFSQKILVLREGVLGPRWRTFNRLLGKNLLTTYVDAFPPPCIDRRFALFAFFLYLLLVPFVRFYIPVSWITGSLSLSLLIFLISIRINYSLPMIYSIPPPCPYCATHISSHFCIELHQV